MILYLSTVWIIPLMIYMLINETKFKKNIVIGVTLPQSARTDSDVQEVLNAFKKNECITGAVLVALAVLNALITKNNSATTLFMFWILAVIALPYIPYLITHEKLMKLKEEKGWKQEKKTVMVNLEAMPDQNWLSPYLFIPPVIICLIPFVNDSMTGIMMGIPMAVICVLLWFGYRYLYRNKAEAADENTDITIALSRIRKYNWGKMWLLCSYCMALFVLIYWLTKDSIIWSVIALIAFTAVIVTASLRIEMRTRRMQEKLTENSGSDYYVDEDEHWIGGIIYYNPDDSRTIVNNRIGINSTVNFATPLGKLFLGLTALLLLAMPVFGMYIDGMGSNLIEIKISDTELTAHSGLKTYTVSLDEIESAELRTELPDGMKRVAGTGLPVYLEGGFYAPSVGNMKVMLDPTVSPYILIHTDKTTYLFGARDAELTEQVFNQLNK